jgi:tripartite-type tricarboxylate transporter receptor subunit TctC
VNAVIVAAMKTPAFAEKLEAQSLIPVFDTPEQFGDRLRTLRSMWAAFIRRNAIAQDQ